MNGITDVVLAIRRSLNHELENNCSQFDSFYHQHEKELQATAELLEDDYSRDVFARSIDLRRTGNWKALKGIVVKPQYFQKDIFGPVENEVFVDGGAFIGDTIKSYVENFGGRGYKKIYAWEPSSINRKGLKRTADRYGKTEIVPYGMWNEKSKLSFNEEAGSGSHMAEEGEQCVVTIDVDSIDNVCAGDKVTLIKMDVEGSELKALEGAINVIKRDKPRLAICVYHKPEDLYEIPQWIKSVIPEYKLYLRQHERSDYETVLYATL